MEIEVKSLTHEEISNILEVATYGSDYISIHRPKQFDHLIKPNHQYGSEKWADILLGGGYILVWDMDADADEITDKLSEQAVIYDRSDRSIAYKLSLDNLLHACSLDVKAALDSISGEGDVMDAYNLVQMAIFGEVIYG